MDKITEYINNNEIETIVKSVINNKKDIVKVIQQVKDCRTAFQIKTQELQWALEKHLDQSESYYVRQILVAKEDCMNNFRKNQRVEIKDIREDGILIDGVVLLEKELVRKYFIKET